MKFKPTGLDRLDRDSERKRSQDLYLRVAICGGEEAGMLSRAVDLKCGGAIRRLAGACLV